ncbi:MAG TPA: helix-turn-helix domain-containing protein [Solirubrobacteraceae bacterium]
MSAADREGTAKAGDPPRPAARARILAAARELFYRRGINATGIAELCVAAHVSKRTLYQHFAGKDELVAAYLETFAGDPGFTPEAILARADLAPRARLLELFAALAVGGHPLRGDPFVNAAVELADPASPGHATAAAHKREFGERLANLAREAGARDPDRVGRRLALLYDGAAAQIVVHDRSDAAAEAQALAAAILRDAID